MRQVLESGRVDPDSRDGEGTTPLMLAAAGGHMDVLTTLLEEGADPNIRCRVRVGVNIDKSGKVTSSPEESQQSVLTKACKSFSSLVSQVSL